MRRRGRRYHSHLTEHVFILLPKARLVHDPLREGLPCETRSSQRLALRARSRRLAYNASPWSEATRGHSVFDPGA